MPISTTTHTLFRHCPVSRPRILPFLSQRISEARLEERHRRASRLCKPLVLGTLERPWDPTVGLSFATLHELLRERQPIAIRIACRSPRLLHDAPLLADLDQRHAVQVDVPIASARDGAAFVLVRALGDRGVAASLVATEFPGEVAARSWMRDARAALAADVRLALPPGDSRGELRFARLRLEYGFPRALPGRG